MASFTTSLKDNFRSAMTCLTKASASGPKVIVVLMPAS